MTLAFLIVVTISIVVLTSALPRLISLRRLQRRGGGLAPLRDPLTGLPSRAWLLARLDQMIAQAKRHGYKAAVLVIDLDRFAAINNRIGDERGDLVLKKVAKRLNELARTEDTIARLSGDQFVVLLEQLADSHSPARVAQRIIESFRTPLLLDDGEEVTVSVSIGVAIYGTDDSPPDDLLRDASLAMQRAKEKGRGRFENFDADLGRQAVKRLILESRMKNAVLDGELVLHFQPEVLLDTGQILGMEALVRWQHPVHGLLSPAEFIPVAEKASLIDQIDGWVLGEACRVASKAERQGLLAPRFRLNVNLSVHQFRNDRDFPQHVALALARTGLAPERLAIEITETAQEIEPLAPVLQELRAMGIAIALDDFGIGYSSLSRLMALPVNILKIDQLFVHAVTDPAHFAVVRTVNDLGTTLGMDVVAEGIETPEQLTLLQAAGCRRGQGYLFSRPVPADEITALLGEGWLSWHSEGPSQPWVAATPGEPT